MAFVYAPTKHPDEIKPYYVVFCDVDTGTNTSGDYGELQGATISTVAWTAPSGLINAGSNQDAVTIKDISYGANTVATLWAAGGTDAADYDVECKITTSDSRTLTKTFTIQVRGTAQNSIVDYIAGSAEDNETYTHAVNFHIKWTQTTLSTASTTRVRFRYQDSSNFMRLAVNSAGNLTLSEIVDNIVTNIGGASAVVSAGDVVHVICYDDVFNVYVGSSLKISDETSTVQNDETDGLIILGGAVVDNFSSWNYGSPIEDSVFF